MHKILFIANEFQTGGATKSLIGLARRLKENHEIEPIIFVNKLGYLTDMCEKYSIKYYKLNYKSFIIGSGNNKKRKIIKKMLIPFYKIRHFIFNQIALIKAKKIIEESNIEIIHTNTNRDDFGAILAQKYNIPHVWHLREFGEKDYECIALRKNYIEYMNNSATMFIAISKVIKDFFIEKGIKKEKIELVYNGVKINNKEFKRNNSDGRMKIIFMGGITKSKGQYQVIEALKLIPKDIRKNISIDFYGNGAETYINSLKIDSQKLEMNENVKFNSYCNDIEKIIKDYDVGIMCSQAEAFGRVTVEYMSNNLITIASNTGANPEIINDGENGYLYEYNNFKSLADVLLKVYNLSENEKIKINENAYVTATKFSDKNNASNVYNLYVKILDILKREE